MDFYLVTSESSLQLIPDTDNPNRFDIRILQGFNNAAVLRILTATSSSAIPSDILTPLQFLINSEYKYLDLDDDGLYTPSDNPTNSSVSYYTYLNDSITFRVRNDPQIYFNNYTILLNYTTPYIQPENITFLSTTNPPQPQPIVPMCPYGFTLSPQTNTCESPVDALAFGIRYQVGGNIKATTFTLLNSELSILAFKNVEDLAPNTSTRSTNFIEHWAYVDLPAGETFMYVGKRYPLYFLDDVGTKVYLKEPVIIGMSEEETPVRGNTFEYTEYRNTATPSDNVLAFVPTETGDWRQYTFTTRDFDQLLIPDLAPTNRSVALWQNADLQGQPAVYPSIEPFPSEAIHDEWWFWLLIALGVIAILIALFV